MDVPPRVTVLRTIVFDPERCLGCGTCARACPAEAMKAQPPQARAGRRRRGMNRPLVLLCECAGTMANVDFGELQARAGGAADTERGRHWCSREGQARLLELMEQGRENLVFAGCARDFAARRFQKLLARGLQLEFADIREAAAGCTATTWPR